jgi:hypothetical protein
VGSLGVWVPPHVMTVTVLLRALVLSGQDVSAGPAISRTKQIGNKTYVSILLH